jgi:hypothetical protein
MSSLRRLAHWGRLNPWHIALALALSAAILTSAPVRRRLAELNARKDAARIAVDVCGSQRALDPQALDPLCFDVWAPPTQYTDEDEL